MVVPLVFILFTALIFNMYIKLTRIIGNVINFFIHIFIIFSVLFLEFIIFSRFIVFFFSGHYIALVCFCKYFTFFVCFLLIVMIIICQQVLLFFVFILILTKIVTALKVIITTFWMIYGYFLEPCFFFLKVWFNSRSNIKLRVLVISIVSVVLFLHKHRLGKEEKGWRVVTTHLLTKASG